MASAAHTPPRSPDNLEEQGILQESKYFKIIKKNMARVCKTIIMSGLWVYLIALSVIDVGVIDELKTKKTNAAQGEELLLHLLKQPVWRFHGFCRALCQNNQQHVVRIMGLDPGDYEADQDEGEPREKRRRTSNENHKMRVKEAINSHRDVYRRTLMQGSLFDIPSLDLPYNMEKCFIHVVATSDGFSENLVPILPEEMLKVEPGNPKLKTALLSGPPGGGKSTIMRYYVYKWSQTKDGQGQWDLIIMLNLSTLQLDVNKSQRDNIKEAIKQSLRGRGDKDLIMKAIEDDQLNVLIIPDGIDECRNMTILEMLKELIHGAYEDRYGLSVLGTCRSALIPYPLQYRWFERQMKIDGFTREQGIEYVTRFYKEIMKPEDDSVYKYIANSKGELDHILTNPLCTHILSIVTADGTLTLRPGQGLRLKWLFKAMEDSMKRRQLEKHSSGEERSQVTNQDVDKQAICFYMMTLYALLKDVRKFDTDFLGKFNCTEDNPYFTFMKKERKTSKNYWHFSHEMFHEHFSATALERLPENTRNELLLIIASERKYRNTQRILFSALGEDEDQCQILSDMICANLVLQSDLRVVPSYTSYIRRDYCYSFLIPSISSNNWKTLIEDTANGRKTVAEGPHNEAHTIWQQIRETFLNIGEKLRGDLSDELYSKSNESVLSHINVCLKEVSPHHQTKIMERLFPTNNTTGTYTYATGGTRWSSITDNVNKITVNIPFSLRDSAAAVRQHRMYKYGGVTDRRRLGIILVTLDPHFVNYQSSWGDPALDELTNTESWTWLMSAVGDLPVTAKELWLISSRRTRHDVSCILNWLLMKETESRLKNLLVVQGNGLRQITVWATAVDGESLCAWADQLVQQDVFCVSLWLTKWINTPEEKQKEVERKLGETRYSKHLKLGYH